MSSISDAEKKLLYEAVAFLPSNNYGAWKQKRRF
jgi:hypothetical protein